MTSYATEILVRELMRQRLRDAEHERLARTARARHESARSWRGRLTLRGIRWPGGAAAQVATASAATASLAGTAVSEPCA